ncbi:MAG: ABC transporter permease subunit [Lachnospiraceae bacterium]|nr:ABC transporter permease subunit [Lachnospiraceae bacterium]
MKGSVRIIKKELKRVFGNKRLIFSMYIMPVILMFLVYGFMGKMMGGMQQDIVEHTSQVYVVDAPTGMKEALDACGYSNGADITYMSADEFSMQKGELEFKLKEAQIDLIVKCDADFYNKFESYAAPTDAIPSITLCYNSTSNYSSRAYNMFNSVAAPAYKTVLQAERFGDLNRLVVFNINEPELFEYESKKGTQFLSMILPYMIVLMLFTSAMSITVDAIAGEKERGTMASMLLAPINRSEIVVGKIVSLAILSGLSALCYAVSMVFAIPLMGEGMGEELDLANVFGIVEILELIAIVLFIDLLFVSILIFVSILAKDSKTASTYAVPIMLIVIAAGIATMFSAQDTHSIVQMAIPVYGNALVIQAICNGGVDFLGFLASIGGLVVGIVIFTIFTTKAFNSEKIMFNA